MAAKDSAGVSRFAKLFHPLGAIGPDIHVDNEIFMIYIYIYIYVYIIIYIIIYTVYNYIYIYV